MADVTLLDGGMGQELIHRSGDTPTPLWSTRVMVDRPGLVAEIHRDFTAAGATVATTNTYAILRDRLEGTDVEDAFDMLYDRALSEAKGTAPRLAGSVGPIGASYRPDLHPAPEQAVAIYREIVDRLAPAVDVLLFETVSCVAHARDALAAAQHAGKPVWISVTVDDRDGSRLRSGEPVRDVLDVTGDADAVLVNCSTPEVIPAALAELATAPQSIGAYANGFEQISDGFLSAKPTVDTLTTRCDFSPALYADHVMGWVDAGATIVGGCCEVSPAHIAEIARRLRDAGHTIV